MRIAPWLLAVLFAAPAVRAQSVIDWSSERRLTKDDFKGRVPATTAIASLSWLNVNASWECKAGELVGTARATFDPTRSWWRQAQGSIWEGVGEGTGGVSRTQMEVRRSVVQRDLALLEHEQLHFDLAELAARTLRKRFEETKGSCADSGGGDGLRPMVLQVDRELQEEQSRYDRETTHGSNPVAQAQWRERVRKLLESAPAGRP